METYLQTVKEEWVKLINETDPDVHRLATELAGGQRNAPGR